MRGTTTSTLDPEPELFRKMDEHHVMMMGDNPALAGMPQRPTLMDFFRLRFTGITGRHLLTSAARALDDGLDEKVILGCLLHDISNGCLIRTDHGYWGAQMIAPYVSERRRLPGLFAIIKHFAISRMRVPGISIRRATFASLVRITQRPTISGAMQKRLGSTPGIYDLEAHNGL
jgi:hypothetical protein